MDNSSGLANSPVLKAIRTRYVGPTNTRGARIVATDGDRNTLSISYPHELNSNEAHRSAATALADRMKWTLTHTLVGGGFKNDCYWVLVS